MEQNNTVNHIGRGRLGFERKDRIMKKLPGKAEFLEGSSPKNELDQAIIILINTLRLVRKKYSKRPA